MENVSRLAAHVRAEMSKVIIGQQAVVDQLLLVVLCSGHALIEGVPGLAKTLLARTLALEAAPRMRYSAAITCGASASASSSSSARKIRRCSGVGMAPTWSS